MGEKAFLSARMQAVADMVSKGNRVCDVGCDHGYIPIYLVRQGIAPFVLAMDINKGPLGRAGEHVFQAGLRDYITLRLSDGLFAYEIGEAQTLVCAGMGGRLMRKILERQPEKTGDFKELVLQPQSELTDFRKFLRDTGYHIADENMVLEEGKFYTVIRAVPGSKTWKEQKGEEECFELWDRFGPELLGKRHPVLGEYLKREWHKIGQIRESLAGAGENGRILARKNSLDEEMAYLKKAAEVYGLDLEGA